MEGTETQTFLLHLQKLDRQQSNGINYAVFGPNSTEENLRPRPKLTIDPETWDALGNPASISIDIHSVSLAEVEVLTR